jgi:hypothetical protein
MGSYFNPHYARTAVARSWRWPSFRLRTRRGGAGGRDGLPPQYLRDRGAKRIRSLYLPRMIGMPPKLSTTTPPKDLALLSTINGAITPRPDAFADLSRNPSGADLPATAHLQARLHPLTFILSPSQGGEENVFAAKGRAEALPFFFQVVRIGESGAGELGWFYQVNLLRYLG